MTPPDPRRLKEESLDAQTRGDDARALELFEQLAVLEPDEVRWQTKMAETHRALGHVEQALACYHRAVDAYVSAGATLRAMAACRVILQLAPDDAEALSMVRSLGTSKMSLLPTAPGVASVPDARSLEQLPIGALLPSQASPGQTSGVREVDIDRRAAPVERGYTNLELAPVSTPASRGSAEPDPLDAGNDLFSSPSTNPAAPHPLRALPLLGTLPREALDPFVRAIGHRTAAPGDTVISEGEIADCVYLVVRGDLVATRGKPPRPLARLGEGAFFGEMALLDDAPRSASVVAVTDAELLVLPRTVVLQLCERHPSVLASLIQSLRTRLIATLTRTSPLFAQIPSADREGLVSRFKLREIEAGTEFIREGARADGLSVLLTGRASVVTGGESVATLGTGDVCGEMSLLSRGKAEATVRAETRITALTLPARDFQEVIMVHPQVLEHLATLSDARRAELSQRRARHVSGV